MNSSNLIWQFVAGTDWETFDGEDDEKKRRDSRTFSMAEILKLTSKDSKLEIRTGQRSLFTKLPPVCCRCSLEGRFEGASHNGQWSSAERLSMRRPEKSGWLVVFTEIWAEKRRRWRIFNLRTKLKRRLRVAVHRESTKRQFHLRFAQSSMF